MAMASCHALYVSQCRPRGSSVWDRSRPVGPIRRRMRSLRFEDAEAGGRRIRNPPNIHLSQRGPFLPGKEDSRSRGAGASYHFRAPHFESEWMEDWEGEEKWGKGEDRGVRDPSAHESRVACEEGSFKMRSWDGETRSKFRWEALSLAREALETGACLVRPPTKTRAAR